MVRESMSALKIIIEMKLVCVLAKTNLPREIHFKLLQSDFLFWINIKILGQASPCFHLVQQLKKHYSRCTETRTNQFSTYRSFSSVTGPLYWEKILNLSFSDRFSSNKRTWTKLCTNELLLLIVFIKSNTYLPHNLWVKIRK